MGWNHQLDIHVFFKHSTTKSDSNNCSFYCSLIGGLLSEEIFYKRDYNLEICIEWVNYQPIIGWVMICACFGAFGMRGVFPDPKWGSWSCCFALPFWGMKKTRMFRCIWSIHPFSKDPFPMQTLVSERILESIVLKSSVEPSKRSKMMFLPTGFVASNPWLVVFSCRVFLYTIQLQSEYNISHEKKDPKKRTNLK